MLRSAAGLARLLQRLPQRAPQARAALLPLLAACAPEACGGGCARSLHVFATISASHGEYCKVEVGDGADASDLKKAIIAELKLDAAPHCLRLLREVGGGGAPVPLDGREKLADQLVEEGTSVLVEAIAPDTAASAAAAAALPPPLPPLPPPLAFAEACLGGEPVMVANLQRSPGVAAPRPFYLTLQEHSDLLNFLGEAPSDTPQMLLLVGPIKCGKTRVVHTVIPRLLAARYAAAALTDAAAPRPVIFSYTFPQAQPAEEAAQHFVRELLGFARGSGIAMEAQPSSAGACLDAMPRLAAQAAERAHARGWELWLLLDELGAPIVASSASSAGRFTEQLKDMVGRCSPYARVVGTGSGMVALLTAINAARPNGFVLTHAISRVSLGREPAPRAALAMAQGILAAYAHRFPPAIAPAMTPQAVLALLARSAQGEHTSPRPALVAYLATLVGFSSLRGTDASAEVVLKGAMKELLGKLRTESARDTATALLRMPASLRLVLRALTVLGRSPDADDDGTAGFVAQLCEAGSPLRLMPPYGALLRSCIAPGGGLGVNFAGGGLEEGVAKNLAALSAFSADFSREQRMAISEAVLRVLSRSGVGVPLASGAAGALRAPATVEEVAAMPAVQAILSALDKEAVMRNQRVAPFVDAAPPALEP